MENKPALKEVTEISQNTIPAAAIRAQLQNDWAGVSDGDRLKAVMAICKALDIPTPLNPFKFINMKGRVVLYAPSEASQLLADAKKASVLITGKVLDQETGIYTVECRVTTQARTVDNYACVYIGDLKGEARANAMMKCATKAQRRTVFGAFGLSVADDDDLAFIPPAEPTKEPIDEETADIKAELFKQLMVKFGKSIPQAQEWVEVQSGKKFDQLNATDANELLAKLEQEEEQLPLPLPMGGADAE